MNLIPSSDQQYSLQWLLDQSPDTIPGYIYFWGHQPSRDGSISHTCMSQWWISKFEYEGIVYNCAEQWMMAEKARLFDDQETLEKILATDNPGKIKQLGREIVNFDEEKWVSRRYAAVREGNFLKFSQQEEMKQYLLNTAPKVLVEASPVDFIWGVGLAANQTEIVDPANWKGLNLLGFALMEVRDLLLR